MISPSQRPVPDNTQHSQQTNIHAPGGIRTHNLSRRAAKDLCLRPRGHWDWHCVLLKDSNWALVTRSGPEINSRISLCVLQGRRFGTESKPVGVVLWSGSMGECVGVLYRGADKSLARPGRKQATATEYFDFHIPYLQSIGGILVQFIYITRLLSNEIFSGVLISP